MTTRVVGEQKLGHYTLVREAGHGGMSVVYEAKDTRIGRRVAIKVAAIPPHLTAGQREAMWTRLGREARAIARLSHPNIVSIYDVGEEDNRHFLVMEYLDGQTLRDRLTHGPLLPAEASLILDQVAAALDAVHAAGVVHRDVKPSNVMLLADGRAKLMDFGVARQADDTLVTQAGMIVGSPAYMAPESIDGGDATAASDLWSLGVLLYEMLAGHAPFTGQSIANVLYQVTNAPLPPLASASPAVRAVLARALDRDPSGRYPSARALADAFRETVAPRRPRESLFLPPRPPGKPMTRSRASWKPVAVLVPALLAALAGGTLLRSHRLPGHPARVTKAQPRTRPPYRGARPRHTVPVATLPVVQVADTRQERKSPAAHHRRRRYSVSTPAVARGARTAPPPRQLARIPRQVVPHRSRALRPMASLPLEPRRALRHRSAIPTKIASASDKRPGEAAPGLLGTWHGTHSHNPATLTITRSHPGGFDGVMTVQTHEALVRVGITGHVSGGQVTMRETRVLSQSRPRAWDLGSESGQLDADGQMRGTGSDIRGRFGRWSFSH